MEFKRLIIFIYSIFFLIPVYGKLINPNEKLKPYDVVIEDEGIKQTWLFAHPNNKKVTGPYERFRIMIYGQQYQHLINHNSHKIKLVMNNANKFIYKIEILDKNKQLFFYEWHVEKGSDKECKNCWFTSAVSRPVDQGNTI